MARIPTFTDSTVALMRGLPRPQAPAAAPALQVGAVTQALDRIVAGIVQEGEIAATRAVQERATREQGALPPTELASTPEGLAARYRRAFVDQTRAVQSGQLEQQAIQARADLLRKNRMSPEGFANDWAAYETGVRSALDEQDPTQAAVVGQQLAKLGNAGLAQLEDAEFTRNLAVNVAEASAEINNFVAQLHDRLVETGDMQARTEGLLILREKLERHVAKGLLDAGPAEARFFSEQDKTATETLTQQFWTYQRHGDMESIGGLIDALEQEGQWYTNNPEARRMAAWMRQQLAALGEDGESVGLALRRLREAEKTAELGGLPDLGQAAHLHAQVWNNPKSTPLQRDTASQRLAGAQLLAQEYDLAYNRGLGALNTRAGALRSEPARNTFGSAATDAALENIRRETASYAARLGDKDFASHVPEGFPGPDLTAGTPEEVARGYTNAQRHAERVFGVQAGAVRGYSSEVLSRGEEAFSTSLRGFDADAADAVVERFLAPVAGAGPWNQANLALQSFGTAEGLASTALMATALADPGLRREMTQLLVSGGEGVPTNLNESARVDAQTYLDGGELQKWGTALSFGNGSVQDEVIASLASTFWGAVKQERTRAKEGFFGGISADDRGAVARAKEQMKSLFGGLDDVHRFSNGALMPRRFLFSHPDGQRVVADAVEAMYADPEQFGLLRSQSESLRFLYPVPIDADNIGFRDTRVPGMYANPKTGELVTIKPRALAAENRVEEAVELPDQLIKSPAQQSVDDAGFLAKQVGTDERLLQSYMWGMSQALASEVQGRSPADGRPLPGIAGRLSPEELDQAATLHGELVAHHIQQGKLLPAPRSRATAARNKLDVGNPQLFDTLGSKAAITVLMNKMLGKYDGDKRKAVVATTLGDHVVDAAIKQEGDRWLTVIDDTLTRSLLGRMNL